MPQYVNVLLQHGIFKKSDTSLSREYRAPVYRVYSSMALRDDLANSDSYYIVAIKS